MQNFSLKTHIGADGILHLDLPVAVKNTDLKVTVICNPLTASSQHPLERYVGCFSEQEADDMLADIIESRQNQTKDVVL